MLIVDPENSYSIIHAVFAKLGAFLNEDKTPRVMNKHFKRKYRPEMLNYRYT